MKRGLAPNIQDRYSNSCKTLVELFLKELDLEGVLSRARSVFLLEAGDLMHQFCSNLFSQLEPGVEDQADSASLTLTLQDTLASRYPSWADQFSVELQGNNLEGVTLHLRTQWPLTLVLNQVWLMIFTLIRYHGYHDQDVICQGQLCHIQLCLPIFGRGQTLIMGAPVHQVENLKIVKPNLIKG